MKRLVMFLILLAPTTGYAAPFCIDTETVPSRCYYFDARECQREAVKQNGACSDNAPEFTPRPGIGHYCVVSSMRSSSCNYLDPATCAIAAAQQGGACIFMSLAAPTGAPDPFGNRYGVSSITALPVTEGSLTGNSPVNGSLTGNAPLTPTQSAGAAPLVTR